MMSRRSILLGGAALLATTSCRVEETTGVTEVEVPAADGVALVALFAAGSEIHLGGEKRLPFAVADPDGTLRSTVPDHVVFTVDLDGETVLAPSGVRARRDGIERPYYPVWFTPERAGLHRVVAEVDGAQAEAFVSVGFNRSSDLRVGRPLPPVFTPTFDRQRGVDPICTRVPTCPLHGITVRDALRDERPVAVLVASPGSCDISYCPPALDLLLLAVGAHPRMRFVHAEVYLDPAEGVDSVLGGTTDIVAAYGLDHEPALFVADAAGVLQHRLDHIFDASELTEVLDAVDGQT